MKAIGSAVALVLLLLYGVPLFAPPAALYPAAPAAGAGLWERLFPQVPAWWVVGRLICLGLGAGWIAWSARAALPLLLPGPASAKGGSEPGARQALVGIALLLASVHAASGMFAAQFNRLAEVLYFIALVVPAALLASTEIRRPLRLSPTTRRRLAVLLVLPLLWVAFSALTAWRSPRAASLVDMWIMVERLDQVIQGYQSILADSADPGHTNAYMMLQGVPLIGSRLLPLSFVGLQVVHFFWTAVCGFLIGVVTWRMISYPAAIVGQSVFLFSPYVLSTAYNPGMNQIAPLCTVTLLALLLAVRELRSAAALAAFGAVVGFSTTEPTVYLTALLLCGLMAYTVMRMSPVPWLGLGVAALSFAAAVLPGLPNLATLPAMVQQYTFGRGQLASVMLILFGQESVSKVRAALTTGSPGPFDIPLGALLAPFAIARTPLRLWGDTLIDPLGAACMAVGLVLCLLYITRSRAALFVLALLAAALAHAFTSRGDAVSHARLVAAFVPIALLAGVGFEALRKAFGAKVPPIIAGALAAASIAVSGSTLFIGINPKILPASALAITLEALDESEPDAVLVDDRGVSWLYLRYMAQLLPARPLRVISYDELDGLEPTPDAARRVLLWSPGLEQERGISRSICKRWPQAALYTLTDRTGLFRALAACPGGDLWQPLLPRERWQVSSCQRGGPAFRLLDEPVAGIVPSTDG